MQFFTCLVALSTLGASFASENNLEKERALLERSKATNVPTQLGPRPFYLVRSMDASALKSKLEKCAANRVTYKPHDFSIGHRGAALQFPEHTMESYLAAVEMGAGIIECDVTFSKDLELVCRHSQCDLHTTTNIVTIPALNAKCSTPWAPGVAPNCCTSDFTLAELRMLCAKMDSSVPSASTALGYLGGTADWRTDLYSYECPKIVTHAEYVAKIKSFRRKFTPELKTPSVAMPFMGEYTQEMYAQHMIDHYLDAGVDPDDVWPQSFLWDDVIYWTQHTEFHQGVALDGDDSLTFVGDKAGFLAYVAPLLEAGVMYLAPPMWKLVTIKNGKVVASDYAKYAKEAGFKIITWTLERSGPLKAGGGYYYQSITALTNNDGDAFDLLHVLAMEVGIVGIFSDWPATVTFYANCML